MDDGALLSVLHSTADAVADALSQVEDWGLAGTHDGQHHSDMVADSAGVKSLRAAGLAVLSEESGSHGSRQELTVAFDPLDGSTNAAQGIPWYATSLCVLDSTGPRVALVANLVNGVRYAAVRGSGATRDGRDLAGPSTTRSLGDAIILLSGFPGRHLGWRQYRALGAAALDLCAVADGIADAYVDCTAAGLGPWDYLGGLLVCQEAGALVADRRGEELVARDHSDRRTPMAASTVELLQEIKAAISQR